MSGKDKQHTLPKRWRDEKKASRSVQIAFDTSEQICRTIRVAAAENNLTPSDMIRKIVGLAHHRRPVRPRLSLSLNEDDYLRLAKHYGLDPDNRQAIKAQVMADLLHFSRKTDSSSCS